MDTRYSVYGNQRRTAISGAHYQLSHRVDLCKGGELIEEELDSLNEPQSEQPKQIASEVGKQTVCLKISGQFKESMKSIADNVKQNITQKV